MLRCSFMIKKLTKFILLGFILLVVVKGFFFSGIANLPPDNSVFKKAEAGFVWVRASGQYARSKVGEFFLGQHYRSVWAVPVKVPVIDINQMYGGLTLGKLGGGMQTISLNLKDKQNNTYVLRSLNKYPIGVLPPFLRRSVAADLIRDQIAAANPYAALVVAPLAEAAGIFHTNPRIFFVSATDQNFRPEVKQTGNKLFLFEEKFSHLPPAPHQFGAATAILNSVEMLDKRFRFNAHVIDQALFLRCRLFDILIGDWDRHEGQWNWAAYPTEAGVLYKPIPKDRDQAFSRYQDGLLPWLLTRNYSLRKFGQFNNNPKNALAYTINASFLDERALNAQSQNNFREAARELKTALTDEAIDWAVKQFPPSVYQLVGPETARILKNRRNQLLQIADAYYAILAKQVVIAGTDEKEKFEITRLPGGKTKVRIFAQSDADTISRLYYQRVFTSAQTNEITLHGLGGEDIFTVQGQADIGSTIRIVGGTGADYIQDNASVVNKTAKTMVYDTKKGNTIFWGKSTVDKTSNSLSVHHYDREGF